MVAMAIRQYRLWLLVMAFWVITLVLLLKTTQVVVALMLWRAILTPILAHQTHGAIVRPAIMESMITWINLISPNLRISGFKLTRNTSSTRNCRLPTQAIRIMIADSTNPVAAPTSAATSRLHRSGVTKSSWGVTPEFLGLINIMSKGGLLPSPLRMTV